MGSESAGLSKLAAEFPGYDFGTQRTWDGVSIIAVRQDGIERPGVCVVITGDVDEMRRALLEGGPLEGDPSEGSTLPEPRAGSSASGSPASGSPASGSPASGSPASGSPALGSSGEDRC